MVAPYNYGIQAPSAFESLVSGLRLGTSLQEMEAQREQRALQAQKMQQQMEAEQRRQMVMGDFYRKAKANEPLTVADWLQFGDASGSTEYQKLASQRIQAMPEAAQQANASFMGQTIAALYQNPEIGVQLLRDRIEANPSDQGLRAILKTAETNPKAAAVGMYGMMSGIGGKFSETAKNLADVLGMKEGAAEKAPEDIRVLDALGLARTPENFAKIKQAGQRPEAMTALQKAQAARQTFIAQGKRDSQEFRENEQYIKNQLVDPNALTAAQIESNRLAQARLDQMERLNSPEYQAALSEAKARGTATGQSVASKEAQQRAAVATLKSIGFDPETGEDDISKAIAASTSGGARADIAAVMRYFGGATKGMQEISKLQSAASRITLDILDGNLGAGISNPDRDFILQGLGDIGNPKLTASERLAGWTSAKNRMVQVGLLPTGRPAAPQQRAKPASDMSDEEILRKLQGGQ